MEDPKPEASAPAMPEEIPPMPKPSDFKWRPGTDTRALCFHATRQWGQRGWSEVQRLREELSVTERKASGWESDALHYAQNSSHHEAESERLACEVQRLETENRELLLDMAELHPMDDCAQEIHDLRESKQALEDMIRADAKTLEFLQGTGPIALIGHPLAEVAAHTIRTLQAQVRDLTERLETMECQPICAECNDFLDHQDPEYCQPCFDKYQVAANELIAERDTIQSRLEEAERELKEWRETDWTPPPVEFEEEDGTKRRVVFDSGDPSVGMAPMFYPDDNEWEKVTEQRDHHKADASRLRSQADALAEALDGVLAVVAVSPNDDDWRHEAVRNARELVRLHREG